MNHLAVLASGNGSNLQAIIDTTESGMLPDTRVSVVVSDRISAYALQRAAQCRAAYEGRSFVIPEDVRALAPNVLTHRISIGADSDTPPEEVVFEALDRVTVPA